MCSDLATASQCCAFYSATGIVFMSWVGIMLMKQPFFIGGIEDVELAKGSAFGAAGMFFFTFLVSIIYLIRDGREIARHSDGMDNSDLGFPSTSSMTARRRGGGELGDYANVVSLPPEGTFA